MKTYRVGVVGVRRGAGYVRQFPVFPNAEIAALCDLDEETLANIGGELEVPDRSLFTDYAAFLEAPLDIVVVSTPMQYHAEQVIAALEGGKHVLSEVTAATTIEDCARIVDTVKRTGRVYMMGENCCYWHFIRQWKGWMEAGRLGDIFYAEGEYIHELHDMIVDPETGEKRWRADRPPIYYCTHSLGPLLYLMNDRVIAASGAHSGHSILPDVGVGSMNMEVALFKTEKGAVIKILRSSVAYREPPLHFYSLYGSRGVIETDRGGGWGSRQGKLYVEGEMAREDGFETIECLLSDPDAPQDALRGGHGSTEYYLVRDFLDAVEQNTRPPIDVVRAMDFTMLGICAHDSAMSDGNWVDVPQFGW